MNKQNEYPLSQEELQKLMEHNEAIKASSRCWLDDVPEGMAPHELDYESEDYEPNS